MALYHKPHRRRDVFELRISGADRLDYESFPCSLDASRMARDIHGYSPASGKLASMDGMSEQGAIHVNKGGLSSNPQHEDVD